MSTFLFSMGHAPCQALPQALKHQGSSNTSETRLEVERELEQADDDIFCLWQNIFGVTN